MISSTATTVSESKLAARNPKHARNAAVVILIASSITYIRVLIEIGLIAPTFLPQAIRPLGGMAIVSFLMCAVAWFFWRRGERPAPGPVSPEGLKAALIFGALYALIGVGIATANRYLGAGSLFWMSAISGFTDVDAITLSISQLVHAGEIKGSAGWKMILLASLSNVLFKIGIVAVVGSASLLRKVALFLSVSLATGLLILWIG